MYNLTELGNSTNLLTFYTGVNNLVSGWLTIVILTSIFIISFIMFKGYETITALRTSSFITSILAVLFFSVGMLTQSVLIIFVVFTGLLVLYDLLRKE